MGAPESTHIRDENKSAISAVTYGENMTPRTFEDNIPLTLSNTNRLADTASIYGAKNQTADLLNHFNN